jgi:hypothetical protein
MADEFARVVTKDAINDIQAGIEADLFKLPCSINMLKTFCVWGFTGALNEVANNPDKLSLYSRDITKIYLSILGVDSEKAETIVETCANLTF